MAFSDLFFLFRFLPIFLIIYYVVPAGYRLLVLLAGSLFFYGYGDPRHILLLIVSVGVNIALAEWMCRRRETMEEQGDRRILFLILVLDAGLLAGFKVLNAFVPGSPLPLGLSFYTFKMISFQIDLYHGEIKKKPKILETAAYFILFPQMVSGPIMRYRSGLTAGLKREGRGMALEQGLGWLAVGLATKVLLADRLAILWKDIQGIGFESISTPLAWLGAVGYSMYLYFDFWGYSLMAGGIGLMLGFRFIQNFIHPYAACGIADFYRRWHATLGSWFRDYVYIPLGGSRRGTAAVIRNLMLVWLLTGFWHGGTLNFIIWGVVLGLLIVWEKFVVRGLLEAVPVIGHLHVIILIPLTWVIFAITDLKELGVYFSRLFPFFGTGVAVNPGDFAKYMGIYWPFLTAGILLCVPIFYNLLIWKRRNPIVIAFLLLVFWVSVYFASISAGNPFMYFSF